MAATGQSFVRTYDQVPVAFTEPADCSCGLAFRSDMVQAYNEEAFRYFLDIERRRSEVSCRPVLLLLAEVSGDDVIESQTAAQLFVGMSACLRETDFVGWYREQRVVGAVLTQRTVSHRTELLSEISDRILNRLARHVPQDLVGRIHLRVFHLPTRVEDESQN